MIFLFHPEGKVVKLAQESIHVVVLGFSAAIITADDIRDEFEFKFVCIFWFLVFLFLDFLVDNLWDSSPYL